MVRHVRHASHRRTRPDRSGCERCAASGGDQPGVCQEVFPRHEPAWTHDQLVPWRRQSHAAYGDRGGRWRRHSSSLRAQVQPTWYSPLSQFDIPEFGQQLLFSLQLVVRSRADSPVASRDVAAAIGRVDPQLALTFRPLGEYVNAARNQERLVALLAGAFGALGLLLAGLGLYRITAYAVAVRRAEIGIRMALGAIASRIVRLVLVRVTTLVVSGAVAGIAISLWLSRFVASLLYGVQPRDTATWLGALIVLASVGLVAGAIPASRAARTNPATVLREG